jgi:hypothetical protein
MGPRFGQLSMVISVLGDVEGVARHLALVCFKHLGTFDLVEGDDIWRASRQQTDP